MESNDISIIVAFVSILMHFPLPNNIATVAHIVITLIFRRGRRAKYFLTSFALIFSQTSSFYQDRNERGEPSLLLILERL